MAFVPSITQNSISSEQTSLLIKEVLQNPVAYQSTFFFPVTKIILILLLIGSLGWKNKFVNTFASIFCILMLAVTAFQNVSLETQFGYAVLLGNIIIQFVVIASWIYEIKVKKNDFSVMQINKWKVLVLALAFLAFWMPAENGKIQFSLQDLLMNEAGLTYCMITPVVLGNLLLFYPNINKVTVRITSFVGFYFGIMNMITWFVLDTEYWWMGVLHLPLLIISFVGLILSRRINNGTLSNKSDETIVAQNQHTIKIMLNSKTI